MVMEAVAPTSGPALVKRLAACNSSTRSKTLNSVISWLQLLPPPSSATPDSIFSEDDMKRLWKGLFYCVWHSDKAVNQGNLIERLSSLLLSLPQPLSLLYFSHFLLTLRREWPGIDRLRLDKFYLMIRVFLRKLFELLKRERWGLEITEQYVGILEERLFLVGDEMDASLSGLGDGVAYHVVSVFCDEMKPFLPVKLEVLNVLFRPLVRVMGRTANNVLLGKLRKDLFDSLISNGRGLLLLKKSGEEIDLKDDRLLLGTIAFVMGFSQRFFELGSSSDCRQGNRKVLFALHEEFLKLEKEKEASGVDVSLPDSSGGEGHDSEDEAPQLIPISNGVDKQSKKRKVKGASEDKKKKGASKDKKEKGASKDKMEKDASKDKKQKGASKGENEKDASKGEKENDASKVEKEKKKKKKKKTKKDGSSASNDNENVVGFSNSNNHDDTENSTIVEENPDEENSEDLDSPTFSEMVLSNLQKQFEKVAAEAGMTQDVSSSLGSHPVQTNGELSKKRKRLKSSGKGKKSLETELDGEGEMEPVENGTAKTEDKSVKRVKFSMKNNVVWKPQTPLPPLSVRLPPSATPRGSALKKGVSPGPVRDVSSGFKKGKKKSASPKIGRKTVHTPNTKYAKKLRSRSA